MSKRNSDLALAARNFDRSRLGKPDNETAFIAGGNWAFNVSAAGYPNPAPVAGSADLDKLAADYAAEYFDTCYPRRSSEDAFKAGFAAAKLDNLDQPAPGLSERSGYIMLTLRDDGNHEISQMGNVDAISALKNYINSRHHEQVTERMLGSIENRLMEMQGPGRALQENQMRALMDRYLGSMENIREVGQMIAPISDNVAEILGLLRPEPLHDVPPPAETGKAYNQAAHDMYNEALHKPDCVETIHAVDIDGRLYIVPHPVKEVVADLHKTIRSQEELTAEQAEKIRNLKAQNEACLAQWAAGDKTIKRLKTKISDLRNLIDK